MRAIFQHLENNLTVGDLLTVSKENYHHLLNVVRIKDFEEVLVLDGSGKKRLTRVESLSKKTIELRIISMTTEEKLKSSFDIAVGQVKKEYFEEIIKYAVQLGLEKVTFFQSDYSQKKIILSPERKCALIESALIQSNNPFNFEIDDSLTFENLNLKNYKRSYYFGLSEDFPAHGSVEKSQEELKDLIIIGPEGGLSPREEEVLKKSPNLFFTRLPCYILKSVTAFSTAVGYYWGQKAKSSIY